MKTLKIRSGCNQDFTKLIGAIGSRNLYKNWNYQLKAKDDGGGSKVGGIRLTFLVVEVT